MHIGFASSQQHESLAELLFELHAYYNPASIVTREQVREHLTENLLASGSPIRLVVAAEGVKVIGLAAIVLLDSLVEPLPDKRKQCMLKELFVCASKRHQGVGKALMTWVAAYAAGNGCCRIDWPVQASNTEGIRFYERLGARLVGERLSYRLSDAYLQALAASWSYAGQQIPLRGERADKP